MSACCVCVYLCVCLSACPLPPPHLIDPRMAMRSLSSSVSWGEHMLT